MQRQRYDVFISYRREGGFETAKHLFDLLSRDGYRVSFDLDTLRNGDFNTELLNRIGECDNFILICDAHVFDRTLDPFVSVEHDWLRIELAEALKMNKNIIPIMLNGFNSFPDNLPEDVAGVKYKNGPQYDQAYFDAFYERLKHFFVGSDLIDTDDITITKKSSSLESSILLEHGWLHYNQGHYFKAMEYFLQAADKGSANAINAIALCHYEGRLYERNLQKAAQWFRYAADMGYASGQRNYADCLRKGEGVPQNFVEAFAWYKCAADKGNIKAMYMLGECYENGWGIEQNPAEAHRLKQAAIDMGLDEESFRKSCGLRVIDVDDDDD